MWLIPGEETMCHSNHSLRLDKWWWFVTDIEHRSREIPRLYHVRREAIQNDCLRFRESVRSRNIAGSQRFTKSWFWDSSWVLWEMNVDSTTTNEHSSESSNVWMVPLLAYLFESLLITRLVNACITKCKLYCIWHFYVVQYCMIINRKALMNRLQLTMNRYVRSKQDTLKLHLLVVHSFPHLLGHSNFRKH